MEKQKKIIKCLTAFFRNDKKRIRGAALSGSFARGQGSSASDIDIELLMVEDKIDIDEFTNDIIQLFNQTEESLFVKHTIWLADQRKLALYHGSQLLLIELYLYSKKLLEKANISLLKFPNFSSIIPI
jgi:predicted nucleotidyltransferase